MTKPTKSWLKMSEVYRYMARDWTGLDFSDEAAQEAFDAESKGAKHNLSRNGFAVGKQWANVQVAEWKAGLREVPLWELLEDPDMASIRWWIEKAMKAS